MLHCYRFYFQAADSIGDTDEYVIFAVTQSRAEEIFLAALSHEIENFGWTGEEYERFDVSGDGQAELAPILAVTEGGLGIYDLDKGWQIISMARIEEESPVRDEFK